MKLRHIVFAASVITVAGLGLVAVAQTKPAAGAKSSTPSSVVVYKSPT